MTFKQEVDWTRSHLNLLRVGGTWAVPRSCLVFSRTAEKELSLIARMPWAEIADIAGQGDIPPTEAAYLAWQQEDFNVIEKRATAAGFQVKSNLPEIKCQTQF